MIGIGLTNTALSGYNTENSNSRSISCLRLRTLDRDKFSKASFAGLGTDVANNLKEMVGHKAVDGRIMTDINRSMGTIKLRKEQGYPDASQDIDTIRPELEKFVQEGINGNWFEKGFKSLVKDWVEFVSIESEEVKNIIHQLN